MSDEVDSGNMTKLSFAEWLEALGPDFSILCGPMLDFWKAVHRMIEPQVVMTPTGLTLRDAAEEKQPLPRVVMVMVGPSHGGTAMVEALRRVAVPVRVIEPSQYLQPLPPLDLSAPRPPKVTKMPPWRGESWRKGAPSRTRSKVRN